MVSKSTITLCAAVCLALAGLSRGAEPGDNCKFAVEIVQLQDASHSFKDDFSLMQQSAPLLFEKLDGRFSGVKYGLASFLDKPLPRRGYGPYGGYQNMFHDYCYQPQLNLTLSHEKYAAAISNILLGSGADFPENQLEAMIDCAYDDLFAPPEQEWDLHGRPIIRIMVVVTDSVPHLPGDALASVAMWNEERSWNADKTATVGGFGSDEFLKSPAIMDKESYKALLPFFHKIDNGETLTEEETAQYNFLIELVGPYPLEVDLASPHPGDGSAGCGSSEYPSPKQLGDALKLKKIIPVVLVSTKGDRAVLRSECKKAGFVATDPEECHLNVWQQVLKKSGVVGYVGQLGETSVNLVEAIVVAVTAITDEVCLANATLPVPGIRY